MISPFQRSQHSLSSPRLLSLWLYCCFTCCKITWLFMTH
uniref:Uncharacterized protein n=1 Tax=Arundo donax TaxID=35708 RepID=A0A0A9BSK7_ARUDO